MDKYVLDADGSVTLIPLSLILTLTLTTTIPYTHRSSYQTQAPLLLVQSPDDTRPSLLL